ncbi:DUF998 domain-containing protein [Rhodococcus kronopolitis]|uniref:DUF998 domain-containing protein n=1 Tax=Rhodococcus kronopolitis TaxID=1460226 RepID=A0ABV9G0N5_9NOCA
MIEQTSPAPAAADAGPRRRVRTVLVALLVLGPILYSTWLLGWVLSSHLDQSRAYASELAALDQPWGLFYRTGDLLTGIVLTAAAVLALWLRPRRLLTTVGWLGLGVFAVATILDSRMPLDCAAHASAACAAREQAGLLDESRFLHASTSTIAATAAAVSVFAFIVAAFRYGWPNWTRWTGIAVVLTYVVGNAWTLFAIDMDGRGDEVWLLGYAQRLQLVAVTGWLGYLALIAAWERRRGST